MPIRLDFPISTPIPSPIGIMDISTPSEKKPIPKTSSKAPNKNRSMVSGVSGATVMLIISTIAVIGSTAPRDSSTFPRRS